MTELKWLGFIIMMVIILRFLFLKIFPQKYTPKNREDREAYKQEYPDDEKDNPQEAPAKNPWDPTITKGDTVELVIKDPGEKRPNE